MITQAYLSDLKLALALAEENLVKARAATSFLQHKWRIMDAEEVRDTAQAVYTAALSRYTKALADGEPPATS